MLVLVLPPLPLRLLQRCQNLLLLLLLLLLLPPPSLLHLLVHLRRMQQQLHTRHNI